MGALYDVTMHAALTGLRSRDFSAMELTQAVLARAEAVEPDVYAYLHLDAEGALTQAARADARRAGGDDAPLLGIPLALKDNLATEGVPTTCASRMLRDYVPPFDATVVARLKSAGAILLGKTNLDEFAMGSSTENSAFFATRNPWDVTRVPGGSSGGSAAAVAAGAALAALGTDTGGSVRQPAALCGVVGARPTYGRCSRYGLVAFASSLDQAGPLTRDTRDAALLLDVIAGPDPRDATALSSPAPDCLAACDATRDLAGLRVGVVAGWDAGLEPDVTAAIDAALAALVDLGAHLVEIVLPHAEDALPAYYLIAPAEASANLARFDGVRYGARESAATAAEMSAQTRGAHFGPEVIRRIMLGTYALSAGYYDAYYRKAQQVRTLIRRDYDVAFVRADVIAGPTSPTTAFALGERLADPWRMYQADRFTLAPALAGLPAISVPCGFDGAGLPIGLQLIAPALAEPRMFRAAHAYEQATPWHTRRVMRDA